MNALLRRAPGRHQIISLNVTLDETWTEPEKDQGQILNHGSWTG